MRRSFGIALMLIPASCLALAACGGGGGEDYSIAFTASDISGPSAIRIAGGSSPDVSSSQVGSQLSAILSKASVNHYMGISVDWEGYVNRWGPKTSGAIPDCSPPNTCFSPHNIEPIMVKNGVRLAMERFTGCSDDDDGICSIPVEALSYVGWMDHSMFSVQVTAKGDGAVWGSGDVYGEASRTNPNFGPFDWYGVMVGRNSDLESSSVSNVIQGDASILAELSQAGDMSVDITFSNIKDLNTGGSIADIAWADLSVVDGSFESSTILGSFFGPQHEEVAGVFEKDYVLGAFGARR